MIMAAVMTAASELFAFAGAVPAPPAPSLFDVEVSTYGNTATHPNGTTTEVSVSDYYFPGTLFKTGAKGSLTLRFSYEGYRTYIDVPTASSVKVGRLEVGGVKTEGSLELLTDSTLTIRGESLPRIRPGKSGGAPRPRFRVKRRVTLAGVGTRYTFRTDTSRDYWTVEVGTVHAFIGSPVNICRIFIAGAPGGSGDQDDIQGGTPCSGGH